MRLRRPSAAAIDAELAGLDVPFPYPEVGATRGFDAPLPAELESAYDVDHHRFALGSGRATFDAAANAVFAWRHFGVPWVSFHGGDPPAREDQVVATLVGVPGCWLLNPCRVVYTHRPSDAHAVGFAYGTLPGHVECGEERFVVSLDPATDQVHYEIAAFSRPGTWLTRLGYPFARRLQRRFARASAAALKRALAPSEALAGHGSKPDEQ